MPACRSKQIKEILHSVHNFRGPSLGKILSCHSVVSRWFCFIQNYCVTWHTSLLFCCWWEPLGENCQQPKPCRCQRKSEYTSLFHKGDPASSILCQFLCGLASLPTTSEVVSSPKSAEQTLPQLALCWLLSAGKCEGLVTLSKELTKIADFNLFVVY